MLNELEEWRIISYFSLCLIPLVSPIYTHQALWVLSSCCLFPCPLPPHSLGFRARPSSLPVRGPAEASWSPSLQLKTCQVEFWEDGGSRVLRSSQIPAYKQTEQLDRKTENLWTLTTKLDNKVSSEPQPPTRPTCFRRLCRKRQREATGLCQLDVRTGKTPGSQQVSTGRDGGPVWEQRLKPGGALPSPYTQTRLLHTRLYVV